MEKHLLVQWLREMARHIEEENPLIQNVRLYDSLSDKGFARKILTITFNAPGAPPDPRHIMKH